MTYKNFEHFWLNEGLTEFLASNIIAEVHGPAKQGLFEAFQWDKLKRQIKELEDERKPWRALVNNLTGELHHQIYLLFHNNFSNIDKIVYSKSSSI